MLLKAISFIRRCPVTMTVAVIALMAHAIPPLASLLQFDLALAARGQWWRIWTGHVTHYDGSHLFWDWIMFVVLAGACEFRHPRSFAAAFVLMMAGVSAAIAVFSEGIVAYRGLSGVDTGLFAWFAVDQLRESVRAGDRLSTGLWVVPSVGLVLKLIWEVMIGQMLFVDSTSFRPLVESHIAGAVIGVLCAVVTPWIAIHQRQRPGRSTPGRIQTSSSALWSARNDIVDHRSSIVSRQTQ